MRLQYTHRKLEKVIRTLLNQLPAEIPPGSFSVTYKKTDVEKYRKIVLFIHAEFEAFFEMLFNSIANDAYNIYINKHRISTRLGYLLYKLNEDNQPDINKPINLYISDALTHYQRVLSSNNGIKEKNLKSMMKPLGVDYLLRDPVLNPDFIASINKLGTDRGNFAHKNRDDPSFIGAVTPNDFVKIVNNILSGSKYIITSIT